MVALSSEFQGQTMTMREVYERHHLDKPYIKANYKEALRLMEEEGRILAAPPAARRPPKNDVVTFGDNVRVTFLPQGT